MKMKSTFAVMLLALSVIAVSCKKEDVDPPVTTTPAPVQNSPGNTTPVPQDADGVMWAIRSTSVFQGFEIQIGTAVGLFFNGTTNMVNVGTVSADGNALTAASNNAYTFTPSTTSPTGIDFTSSTNWNVSGSNGHTGFTYEANFAFPAGSSITSGTTVDRSEGYTITCPSVSGADSTLFLVGNVSRTIAGNATSCSFSASELSGLSAGTSMVMIVPYKLMNTQINGKNYYFGKETVNQLAVTIE